MFHVEQKKIYKMALIQDLIFVDDLEITSDGDFRVEFSEDQHVEHILRADKGQFYQHPDIGVGVYNLINGSAPNAVIRQEIRDNLELDDFRIVSIGTSLTPAGKLETDIKAIKKK